MSEIEEVETFIAAATYPGVRNVLQEYLSTLTKKAKLEAVEEVKAPAPVLESVQVTPPVPPKPTAAASAASLAPLLNLTYIPIESFSWDQGSGYSSPTVTVYVDIPGVGLAKDRVSCHFTSHGFDLRALDVSGKNYRLVR